MKFRPHHPQHIAAAKAGFSERTARRRETNRHLAAPPIAIRGRRVADPFDGLWDREIRPMLEAHPGLRPVHGCYSRQWSGKLLLVRVS